MNSYKIPFDNSYSRLPDSLYAETELVKVPTPKLIKWNASLAKELDLETSALTDEELALLFSGNVIPEGANPIALAYSGHQFGQFNPIMGDGRAVLLGEVVNKAGIRRDVQLKGSGITKFSKGGDGKSPLGPVLREYILSEAMFALGVPTTRTLAAVETGENVYRQEAHPGAVSTRTASSHLRVGTFQQFASQGKHELVATLLEHAVDRHFPEIKGSEDLRLAFLTKVLERQAELMSHWMSLGFVHGVMNTDNTLINGETIDYGPCAFLDEYQSDKVFSSIDRRGRYAYGNQPNIAVWNIVRLAECFLPQKDVEQKAFIEKFEEKVEDFKQQYQAQWLKKFRKKLGFKSEEAGDHGLIMGWLSYLEKERLDFTASFRNLPQLLAGECQSHCPQTDALDKFKRTWGDRVQREGIPQEETKNILNSANPIYIPRNHLVEKAILHAYEGNYEMFHEMVGVLENPYEIQVGRESYERPPVDSERVLQTFCGT
jgi:serine/tyrosine/threonine adenylyltransferase